MAPQIFRGRAPRMKAFLAVLWCVLFLVIQASAFQTTIHVASTDPGRKIKTRVNPEYPELALKARISGMARVSMTVAADGSVKDVKEIGGSPVLLAALVRAVKQWKYEPANRESEVEEKHPFSDEEAASFQLLAARSF